MASTRPACSDRRPTRAAMTSRTPSGTPGSAARAPPSRSSSSRWRTSCLTKNGLPPVSAWIAETVPGAASPPISCATSRSSMPSRRSRGRTPPRSSSASSSGSGWPGCSSESRNVPTASTAPSPGSRARCRASSSEDRSAQCMSSTISSTGLSAASRRTTVTTAPNIWRRRVSGSPTGGRPARSGRRSWISGSSLASSGAPLTSSANSGCGSRARCGRSMSTQGPNGYSSSSSQRP